MSEAWKLDDAEIERVARRYCFALGLDPDENVGHGVTDVMTPAERSKQGGFVPAVMLYSPQWALYRSTAAGLIAGRLAMGVDENLADILARTEAAFQKVSRWVENDDLREPLEGNWRLFGDEGPGRADQQEFDAAFDERFPTPPQGD